MRSLQMVQVKYRLSAQDKKALDNLLDRQGYSSQDLHSRFAKAIATDSPKAQKILALLTEDFEGGEGDVSSEETVSEPEELELGLERLPSFSSHYQGEEVKGIKASALMTFGFTLSQGEYLWSDHWLWRRAKTANGNAWNCIAVSWCPKWMALDLRFAGTILSPEPENRYTDSTLERFFKNVDILLELSQEFPEVLVEGYRKFSNLKMGIGGLETDQFYGSDRRTMWKQYHAHLFGAIKFALPIDNKEDVETVKAKLEKRWLDYDADGSGWVYGQPILPNPNRLQDLAQSLLYPSDPQVAYA